MLDRIAIERMEEALRHGGPKGTVCKLDTSSITVNRLDNAVLYAEEVFCESVLSSILISVCRNVRRMRLSLLQRDYVTMGECADEVCTQLQHGGFITEEEEENDSSSPTSAKYLSICNELYLIQDILDNITIAKYLRNGISIGRVEGEPGLLYNVTASGETQTANNAIHNDINSSNSANSANNNANTRMMRRTSMSLQTSNYFQNTNNNNDDDDDLNAASVSILSEGASIA